ncbi:MAG: DUF6338 family protein [Gemmatimonadetes bacterium]|nr:DUF6338 family protein [Gemmatimonadota bacterium]
MENLIGELFPGWHSLKVNSTALVFILAVTPGFIIVFIRSQLVSGRILPYPAGFLLYLTVSTIYWAVLFLVAGVLIVNRLWWEGTTLGTLKWLVFLVFIPVIVGAVTGVVSNRTLLYKTLKKIRLDPIHPTPSAWDWTFSDLNEQYILVKLNNGSMFGGFLGVDSFISSDPDERDMYIEEIFEIDEENNWVTNGHGVYFTGRDISSVEFLPS